MKTAGTMTVFMMLVLQSGGQIQGADEQPVVVQSAPVAAATEPAYCQRSVPSANLTAAVLQQDDQQLLLDTGPGMSRADF